MKKYEYVGIDYKMKDIVISTTTEHKEIIQSYAEKGYRYVGMIPTEVSTNGCLRTIDLIFEIDA